MNTVVDVGGGAGSLLAAILQVGPDMTGTLLDRPEVLEDADHLLVQRGVRERCNLIGGSFFDPIKATGDRWILSQVLHDWPDSNLESFCDDAAKECDLLTAYSLWRW